MLYTYLQNGRANRYATEAVSFLSPLPSGLQLEIDDKLSTWKPIPQVLGMLFCRKCVKYMYFQWSKLPQNSNFRKNFPPLGQRARKKKKKKKKKKKVGKISKIADFWVI